MKAKILNILIDTINMGAMVATIFLMATSEGVICKILYVIVFLLLWVVFYDGTLRVEE